MIIFAFVFNFSNEPFNSFLIMGLFFLVLIFFPLSLLINFRAYQIHAKLFGRKSKNLIAQKLNDLKIQAKEEGEGLFFKTVRMLLMFDNEW